MEGRLMRRNMFTLSELNEQLRQVTSPMQSSDDLVIIRLEREIRSTGVRLRDSPRLRHLNLLDYDEKDSDFQSCVFKLKTVTTSALGCQKYPKVFEKISSYNAFYSFVIYLEEISTMSENVTAVGRRIARVLKCLNYADRNNDLLHFIMCSFKKFRPRCGKVLSSVLNQLCISEELKLDLLDNAFDTYIDPNFLRYFLDVAIENRFDFWSVWERKCELSTLSYCPVTSAFFSGDLEQVEVLFDYGFRQNHYRVNTVRREAYGFSLLVTNRSLESFSPYYSGSRTSVIEEMLIFIEKELPDEDMCSLDMILGYVKCFLLVWDARRDPFVTREELIYAFENKLRDDDSIPDETTISRLLTRLNGFQKMAQNYEWNTLQPRSLQHLCRCTIREVLNDNWQMPHGVGNLNLPEAMESYILLKTTLKDIPSLKFKCTYGVEFWNQFQVNSNETLAL